MITRITSKNIPMQLDSIYSIKLHSLYEAYGTDYDFCRFYDGNGYLLSVLDNECIVSDYGNVNYEELAGFLLFNGYSSILLSPNIGKELANLIECRYTESNLMVYKTLSNVTLSDIQVNERLNTVYDILAACFPNINYESWYLDISHRMRHGVSNVYLYKDVCTVTAICKNYAVLLTLVATSKKYQNNGYASSLLRSISSKYHDDNKDIYVICNDDLQPFYQKNGFVFHEKVATIYNKYHDL